MSHQRILGSVAAVWALLAAVACGSSSDEGEDTDAGAAETQAGKGGSEDVAGTVPCDVVEAFVDNCKGCHGPKPVGGAISLTDHADWHAKSPLYDPSKLVYEVAEIRIEKGEMPQGRTLADTDRSVLLDWLSQGAKSGGAAAESCQDALTDTSTPSGGFEATDQCLRQDAFEPLVARDGETCHEFKVHGASGTDDTTKFDVPKGETYHELYYDVPWEPDAVWTRFGADFDNLAIMHHYLVFTSNASGKVAGQVDRNVLGTTLFTNATLIGGWAVGGCGTELPGDVGGVLPESNLLMIQYHMYNTFDDPQQDASVVQVCTVPAGTRPNTAGITFLGTENLGGGAGMPPGRNDFTTSCPNDSGGDVHIIGFTPHMHLIGLHMKTDVKRLDGTLETIFDEPFKFDYQVGYEVSPQVVVRPGESLVTTCSFMNDTGRNVGFGQSTEQEMCYQYVAYYPAGALDNGVFSLIGATNTCW